MTEKITRRALIGGAAAAGMAGTSVLTACSSGSSTPPISPGSGDQAQWPTYTAFDGPEPDLAGTSDGALDAFLKYPAEPPVAIATAPGDGDPITGLSHQGSGAISPEVGSNPYWQELNERLGSPLELIRTGTADYASKLATILAGGDLPDLLTVPISTPQRLSMVAASSADLTEALAGDAVARYPSLANLPTWAWKLCSVNGAIRGIPIHRGIQSTGLVSARQDMLDLLGMEAEVSDFADLERFCRELNRPKANVFALASNPLPYLRSMVGLPNGWELVNGKLTSAWSMKDQQHEALAAAKSLQDEGLIVPDGLTNSQADNQQLFYAGRGYLIWDSYTAWPGFYRINAANPEFEVSFLNFAGFDGGDGTPALANALHSQVMVGKDSVDRIETILNVVNYLAAPFGTAEYLFVNYGLEGVDYTLDGTDPIAKADTALNLRTGANYLGAGPQVSYLPGRPDAVRQLHASQTKNAEIGKLDPTYGLYSATAERATAATQVLTDVSTDVLLGRKSLDEWDSVIDEWLAGDGDAIRGEFEEALAAVEG